MSIKLEEYEDVLAEVSPEIRDVLNSTFQEASRVMSPTGLQTYMDGAKSLSNLGRGSGVVISYLQEMPLVAKECGEDVIGDCLAAAMKLSSMASGEVVTLLFGSMPTAARNLGDAELFRGYLTLIHQLASTASRGVRPMLDKYFCRLEVSGFESEIKWREIVFAMQSCHIWQLKKDGNKLVMSALRNQVKRGHLGEIKNARI